MRLVPQREDLLRLRRAQNDATRLELAPLADPAVADLIAARAGGKPDAPLLRLARSAAGNPLYVTEIVDALVRSGGLTITEAGTAELSGGGASSSLPRSLSAAITDRLGFVGGPVRDMLHGAALPSVESAVPGQQAKALYCSGLMNRDPPQAAIRRPALLRGGGGVTRPAWVRNSPAMMTATPPTWATLMLSRRSRSSPPVTPRGTGRRRPQ
jgi:hypothetical protein